MFKMLPVEVPINDEKWMVLTTDLVNRVILTSSKQTFHPENEWQKHVPTSFGCFGMLPRWRCKFWTPNICNVMMIFASLSCDVEKRFLYDLFAVC